jgi:FixJ family two-component response regulator
LVKILDTKILIAVVDDDAAVREATRRLLEWLDFRVEAFGSAEHFLMQGNLNETLCLVLDMSLPGMSGLELQNYLARMSHNIPIVFVTGTVDEHSRERALRAGAVAFLHKPVLDQNLLLALRAALRLRGVSWTGDQQPQ